MDSPSVEFLMSLMTWIAWGMVGFTVVGMVVMRRLVARDPRSTPVTTWRNLARGCKRIEWGVFGFFILTALLPGQDMLWVLEFGWRVVLPVGLTFTAMWAGFSSMATVTERLDRGGAGEADRPADRR